MKLEFPNLFLRSLVLGILHYVTIKDVSVKFEFNVVENIYTKNCQRDQFSNEEL